MCTTWAISLLIIMAALAGSGCTASNNDTPWSDWSQSVSDRTRKQAHAPASPHTSVKPEDGDDSERAIYYFGSGDILEPGAAAFVPSLVSGPPVTINLANASIEAAAKAVLGDIFGLNYTVAPNLGGKITIQTSKPAPRVELIRLFHDSLTANGAAIIRTGQIYRVDSIQNARNAASGIEVGAGDSGAMQIGSGVRIVPLRYVTATEMQRILEPITGHNAVISADDRRNTLTLAGAGHEIMNILETIAIFDVDVMKGMSFAVIPVQAARADVIADELRTIFDAGSNGLVRFLPNNRLRSILIASPQRDYLARAEMWIRRIDSRARGQEKQLFSYRAQHRKAKEMVVLIDELFSRTSTNSGNGQSVAPRYQEANLQSGLQADSDGDTGNQASVAFDTASGERVRVAADEANNTLLVLATPQDYKRINAILESLDVSPRQVLLEATIAEISLSDDLKFGVRWYLQQKESGLSFTDLAGSLFDSIFPGFSYTLRTSSAQLTLDALNKITHVNIVSAPSLMVLDNKTATLQIGDQVPIVTQSASAVATIDAPIVNSVSYRDTGVILRITPRINDNGRILLDIEQEVSSVTGTTSSGIDSPTIKQRKVSTSVMVDDGQVLALGGIIQNQKSRSFSKIPILGDLPFFGNAFKAKADEIDKTELIILITPRVAHDSRKSRAITDEYRKRLELQFGEAKSSNRAPSTAETLGRVLK
jgi:general secretion pathway protein D